MFLALKVHRTPYVSQWRIRGSGPVGPAPPPFLLVQTEARRAKEYFFFNRAPPFWFTPPPPPSPYLKVWIRHCIF